MDVSVIFVNYNSIHLLQNAIASVIEHTHGVQYEIIVVDNNSSDNAKNLLQEYFPSVPIQFVALSANIGFGRANNEGFKRAQGRHIFFLNPDTILLNDAIAILSGYLENEPKVGVCGGNLYTEKMLPMHSFSRVLPSIIWQVNLLFFGLPFKAIYGKNTDFNHTEIPIPVGYVTGADMMIKRSVLDKTGGFSDDFFMYFEETELSLRIKNQGYKIMSIPQAKIIHLESQTFSCNEIKQRYYVESWHTYFRKRYNTVGYTCAKSIFLFHTTLKYIFAVCTRKKERMRIYKQFFIWGKKA